MTGNDDPGRCPMCGEDADFSVTNDATVTPHFDVPDDVDEIVGHYDPGENHYDKGPTTYYFHYLTNDGD